MTVKVLTDTIANVRFMLLCIAIVYRLSVVVV